MVQYDEDTNLTMKIKEKKNRTFYFNHFLDFSINLKQTHFGHYHIRG